MNYTNLLYLLMGNEITYMNKNFSSPAEKNDMEMKQSHSILQIEQLISEKKINKYCLHGENCENKETTCKKLHEIPHAITNDPATDEPPAFTQNCIYGSSCDKKETCRNLHPVKIHKSKKKNNKNKLDNSKSQT